MNRLLALLVLTVPVVFSTGCFGKLFGLNLTVVGEKSVLERQVLGTYEEIGRDLSVYASVRGVAEDGTLREAPEITESQRTVLLAMNNRQYNRDDVTAMLRAGYVGEANDGQLVVRNADAVIPVTTELASQVIAEENRDRAMIVERLQQTTPGVTEAQRAEVAWIFATLNHDLAPAGAPIQARDGSWGTK